MKIYKFNKETCKIEMYNLVKELSDVYLVENGKVVDKNVSFKNNQDAVSFGYMYLIKQKVKIRHQILDFKIENGLD